MKITKTQLRRIIKEELNRALREGTPTKGVGDATTPITEVDKFKKVAKEAYAHAKAKKWSAAKKKWTVVARIVANFPEGSSGGILHSDGANNDDLAQAARLAQFKADLNDLGTYFVPELKNVV
jgi:hypothetical protein